MSGKWDADPATNFVRRLGKSAHELGTTGGDASCPEIWELANGDIAVIGSDLVVFNPTVFELTAFYLSSEAVSSYMDAIAERGEALLRGLRGPDALVQTGDELAEAAHTIAGSAGMFGFERLTAVGRRFERAVQAGAAEAPALADGLSAALEVTLQAIHDRTLATADA